MDMVKFRPEFDRTQYLFSKSEIDLIKGTAEVYFRCFSSKPLLMNFQHIAKAIFQNEIAEKGIKSDAVRWFYEFNFETQNHSGEVVFKRDADGVLFEDDWKAVRVKVINK